MKKSLILVFSVFFAWIASAQTIECTFTQARTIQASGKVIRAEGVVSYKSPDQLTMTYTNPEGEYLVISGPMLRSNTQGQKISVDTDKNARFKNLRNTLLNCIDNKYEQAAKDNDAELSVSEKNGVKTVRMKARKAAPRGYSQIIMEYIKGLPVRMVLEEFGGISTEYLFKY
ncbi:MAG: outer membrane lipoprotein carrier protein LolA [Bacteroidales bacterium]|nr:outer membrane lipoprotein carrier protein LolA [Bacteroidales bacterium]